MPFLPLPAAIATLPCWIGEPVGAPLLGGLSNEIWKVTDARGQFVVRLGRDYPFHHVSRDREARITRAAHAAGFAPDVVFTAPGVMVTEFITAQTLGAADFCADPARIARLLHRFHSQMPLHITGDPPLFWVFHVIRDYARTLTHANSRHIPDLPGFLTLARGLEAAQVPLPLIFGHNDLLPANVLDDGQRLWLIDYEYAGFSTAMFDLAGAASNAGMDADQSGILLRSYFGTDAGPDLRQSFAAMQCASLLREAMWAMVSDIHLTAPGVDYAAYAAENIDKLERALERYHSVHGHFAP